MHEITPGFWVVEQRRVVERWVVDPDSAPQIRLDKRVEITAACPKGHPLPLQVTANEAAVRFSRGTGVTLACERCATNYVLDLGHWPSECFSGAPSR